MMNGRRCRDEDRLGQVIATGVVIAVMVRKIAARHLDPNTMARLKAARRRSQLHHDLYDLSRRHQIVLVETIAMP